MQPFCASGQTYLVTGYTHPPYRDTLGHLLAKTARYDRTMIVRGVEGSIQLPLDRRAPCIVDGDDDFVRPEDFGCADVGAVSEPSLSALESLTAGLSVLRGDDHGVSRKIVLYLARVIIQKFNVTPSVSLEEALDSGLALSAWNRF